MDLSRSRSARARRIRGRRSGCGRHRRDVQPAGARTGAAPSGPPSGDPVIVASGDGGWIHLGPTVAAMLARAGFFIVGVDSREYLAAFTSGSVALSERDVQRDFATLVAYAADGAPGRNRSSLASRKARDCRCWRPPIRP